METYREPTLLESLDPIWMFRYRPSDFYGFQTGICPGIFWLPGMLNLLAVHVLSFCGCWTAWQSEGSWALLALVPLGVLWCWFATADVKFRLHCTTRQERAGFDNAVVNWFGYVSTLAFYFVALPIGVVAAIGGFIAWVFA